MLRYFTQYRGDNMEGCSEGFWESLLETACRTGVDDAVADGLLRPPLDVLVEEDVVEAKD